MRDGNKRLAADKSRAQMSEQERPQKKFDTPKLFVSPPPLDEETGGMRET